MHRLVMLLAAWLLCQPLFAQEAPLQVAGAITVNVMQAKQLHDHGALFIDVRAAREWEWGHVEGAIHLDLRGQFAALAHAPWPREIPLVIYCDSEVCLQSALAVEQAVAWGFTRVFYFRGGYFAWQLFDMPSGKGSAGERLAFSSSDP
ncbi:rhodanese-like domain-containing protein [Ectopseudomonas guguanensis]|uniref:rhodanese-like domain-containing protein n=1 Tax=Ectopseudomonas guguanensis TaxID=1198456 RepID=UPI003264C69B